MNRGSHPAAEPPSRLIGRFNEAPIHESGKWSSRDYPADRSARFNEAPIHESGKSAWKAFR